MTIGNIFFILLGVFYFIYTLSYALQFYKTAHRVFAKREKLINSILIWIIPFVWIVILKTMLKPSIGINYGKRKLRSSTNEGHDFGWMLAFYTFFHGSSSDSHSYGGHEVSGNHHDHIGSDYGGYHDSGGSDSTGGDN